MDETRFKELSEEASAGNPVAQFNLAFMLFERNAEGDRNAGIKLIRSAAHQEHPKALSWLGTYYEAKNESGKAFAITRQAAHLDDPKAQYNLSRMYRLGIGTHHDNAKSLHWLRASAHGGYAEAQFALAESYLAGTFGLPNPPKALFWYDEAASRGFVPAVHSLGMLYAHGKYVSKNIEKALALLKVSAKSIGQSAYEIGRIYALGLDSNFDPDLAKSYYEKALELGYAPAENAIAKLESRDKIKLEKDSAPREADTSRLKPAIPADEKKKKGLLRRLFG